MRRALRLGAPPGEESRKRTLVTLAYALVKLRVGEASVSERGRVVV